MANWIPVSYALTGRKEELLDIESKVKQVEQIAREEDKAQGSDSQMCDITHFARLIGSQLTYADLGGYWVYDSNALEWKTTDDGEEYLLWNFKNKYWENPKMRQMIEEAYTSVKIFYEAPAGDTNDKEERFFVPYIKLTKVDGLNYVLAKDGTAMLNCDDAIKGKVLRIPEQIVCNGKCYQVTSFGDAFADPQYGSDTIPPQELEEIFFPPSIRSIEEGCTSPQKTLKAIHFAGDIDVIGGIAFSGCEQLAIVDFAGKVNSIEWHAFARTGIKDIQIPDGTRVDPDAFEGAPFGNKKSLAITLSDAQEIPVGVQFLRKMQYRMDIRILIEKPFDEFLGGPVAFDERMNGLTQQLRWIYDNLGDELLRNTIVGNDNMVRFQQQHADVCIYYYDWLKETVIEVSIPESDNQTERGQKARHEVVDASLDNLLSFFMNLDTHIEKYKEEQRTFCRQL